MIAALMQPYFFPYIGYFQLMRAVDVFAFYDDVQYTKNGWINRNRIRFNDHAVWLTLPAQRLGLASLISERHYLIDQGVIAKIKGLLEAAYSDEPEYEEVASFVGNLLDFGNPNVAAFNANLLTTLAGKLDIHCGFVMSSGIDKDTGLKGEERVIDICRRLGATRYVNAIGGIDLYHASHFQNFGIELRFLRTGAMPARLGDEVAHLSILDVLMRHGFSATSAMMTQCEVIAPPDPVVDA